MGYSSVNTGIDRQIRLINQETGVSYSFDDVGNGLGGNLMNFRSEPVINTIITKPISNGGEQIVQDERNGWKGEFMVTRANSDGDDFELLQELFYAANGRSQKFSIHETNINADGSGSKKYIYRNCAVRMTSTGESKMGSEVEQGYSFEGGRRVSA